MLYLWLRSTLTGNMDVTIFLFEVLHDPVY